MNRLVYIQNQITRITLAIVAIIFCAIVIRAIADPMRARAVDLDTRLAQIQPAAITFTQTSPPVEQWQKDILGKPAIWSPIVEAPTQPATSPEAVPDLKALLADVIPTRQQVGAKAKIITPENPKGDFMAVGEQIHNATIKDIARTSVTFSMNWKGKELTLTIPRK